MFHLLHHFFGAHWSFAIALRHVLTFASLLVGITHTVLRQYKDTSGVPIQNLETVTGNSEHNLTDPALAVTTNHQYNWEVKRANLQSILFNASGPVTIKTNSSSAPTDTIVLTGNEALIWTLGADQLTGTPIPCPITADVTTIFVTNGGSGAVQFQIRALCND